MILPVYLYGHPVLRKMAQPITKEYPKLQELIANMWETMYHSEGVGLAAPGVGFAVGAKVGGNLVGQLVPQDQTGQDTHNRLVAHICSLKEEVEKTHNKA